MKRREFITVIAGGTAAWPLAAHAQQGTPLIGFLASASASGYARVVKEVSDGLNDTGYVEGRNVAVEYRWADFQYDQLPSLAADLVERKVKVIFATGSVISRDCCKKGYWNHSGRLCKWQRSAPLWPGCQLKSAGGQCNRRYLL